MEDAHIGGYVGLAIAGLFFSAKLLELVRIFVEKKRRTPIIRQADKDRIDHLKKLDAINERLSRVEGALGVVTSNHRIPTPEELKR